MGYQVPEADFKHAVTAIAATTNFPSGAAPKALAGNKLVMAKVQSGTLSAEVTVTAATSTLTITGKWQGSNDGSTWVDCFASNFASNVVLTTGTASAVTVNLAAPAGVYGYRYARIYLVTGVGSATTGDLGGATYNYREPGLVQ